MNRDSWIPPELWTRAAEAHHRLLMLDYDGTLAPFSINRDQAVPPRLLLDLLSKISTSRRTVVAVVSGRPIAELVSLIGHLPVRLVGEHGWETRLPGGRVFRHPLSSACGAALERAAVAVSAEPWSGRIETKRTSLMLHTRGLPHDEARQIESCCARLWTSAVAEDELRLSCVIGGIELRAPGRHKGTAVRELIAESLPGALPIYVGDDETDEDAFQEVRTTGFGLLVASEKRPSSASGRLRSIMEMTVFLERWLMLVEGGGPATRPPPLHLRKA